MLAREVVEEAFRLRQLWDPSRHRILRRPPDIAEQIHARSGKELLWQEFEPTAFLYAYTALNSLYSYDWNQSLISISSPAIETSGRERQKINRFIDFTLADDEQKRYFLERLRGITPKGKGSIVDAMEGLYPFPEPDGSPSTLREDVISIVKRITTGAPQGDILLDAKILFKAVYIVRCNIFHGRKGVLDLANDHPQLVRIGVFRQMIVALIDTFFTKAQNRYPLWDPFFDGRLGESVSRTPPI